MEKGALFPICDFKHHEMLGAAWGSGAAGPHPVDSGQQSALICITVGTIVGILSKMIVGVVSGTFRNLYFPKCLA